jgi:hypothetical protein
VANGAVTALFLNAEIAVPSGSKWLTADERRE